MSDAVDTDLDNQNFNEKKILDSLADTLDRLNSFVSSQSTPSLDDVSKILSIISVIKTQYQELKDIEIYEDVNLIDNLKDNITTLINDIKEKLENGSFNGQPFTYADLTDVQKAEIKGEKGDKGEKGEKGDAFTYYDLTDQQKAELKTDTTVLENILTDSKTYTNEQVTTLNNTITTINNNIETTNQNLRTLDTKTTNDITALQTLLASDDSTLDTIQEVVSYIKENRNTLSSLGIANVSGLSEEISSINTNITNTLKEAKTYADSKSNTDERGLIQFVSKKITNQYTGTIGTTDTSLTDDEAFKISITPKYTDSAIRLTFKVFGEFVNSWDFVFNVLKNGVRLNIDGVEGYKGLGMACQSYSVAANDSSTPEILFFFTVDTDDKQVNKSITYELVGVSNISRKYSINRCISNAGKVEYETSISEITLEEIRN